MALSHAIAEHLPYLRRYGLLPGGRATFDTERVA